MNSARSLPLTCLAIAAACLISGSGSATVNPNHGTLVVKKFYDANANGIRDTGEPWLTNWPMTLTGPSGSDTKPTNAVWTALHGGPYSVQEGVTLQTNWVQTAPRDAGGSPVNPANVSVIPCKTVYLNFGNYCTKASNGRTPGFWSNKNGQALMNDGDTMAPELGELSSLNLADAAGNAFDPIEYAPLRTWLMDANAVNMAYQLSRHLAAMTLNLEAGLVNGDSRYLPCNCTINELVADANAALGADPYTPSGDPNRNLQEQLKDWLDELNNNSRVVSPTPCPRKFVTY